MKSNGWIGVDLDGTLAHYDEWRGIDKIGDPVQSMLNRVKKWISEGRTVKIFTARVSGEYVKSSEDQKDAYEADNYIQIWLKKHGLPRLETTSLKDFGMETLYDDRCVQVEKNTGKIIE